MHRNAVVNEKGRRELTGLSRSTWYRLEQRGEVPPRIRLSPGRVGWRVADLEEWIARRERGSH